MELGTPLGGEIILGRPDGIPLAVALGETPELGVGSMMMLEPMTKLEALSEPVGLWDWTAGGGVDVITATLDGSTGVGDSVTSGVEAGVEDTGVADGASVIV
jgi:ribosomal protein S12 methylthiotransferase accessory factor YcaO